MPDALPPLGATVRPDGVAFRVWAPKAVRVALALEGDEHPMQPEGSDVYAAFVPDARAGARYGFRLDDGSGALGPVFPDPHSRAQPDGVHGLSEAVDPAFAWTDGAWAGVPQRDLVFYELHVGTFTPEGTLDAAAERLPYLRELGITAVELMPCHAFPGHFGWGYDPAAFFAPHAAYGRPDSLRRFVDRAHALGLAVFHDTVLNHLGPDGAYVNAYAPMLTARHPTPWGLAVNLDDVGREGSRRFFREASLVWLDEYHMDGLRLDATSALIDDSPVHFLAELSEHVAALPARVGGPRRVLVAEDLHNRTVVTRPRSEGGYGIDAQWVDDLHFQVQNLSGGAQPYYGDYAGATAHEIARTLQQNWAFTGASVRKQDALAADDPAGTPPHAAVLYLDDHDLTGNRPHGDRLNARLEPALFRALSAMWLFAPQLPLVWMGQEWAASTPFPFFADHHDGLAPLVRAGRRHEHDTWFTYEGEPPDPVSLAAFHTARLDWSELERAPHAGTLALYRHLLALRPALASTFAVDAHGPHALTLRRGDLVLVVALRADEAVPCPTGTLEWTTEDAAFAHDPRPPVVANGVATFPAPAAILVRTGA